MQKYLILILFPIIIYQLNADNFDLFMKMNKYKYPHEINNPNLNNDSIIIEFYFQKIDAYLDAQPDSCKFYLDSLKKYIGSTELDYFLPKLYMNYGNYYANREQNEIAIKTYIKAEKYALQFKDTIRLAVIYTNLSIVSKYLDNHIKFFEYSEKAIEINNKIGKVNSHIYNMNIYRYLADYYLSQNNFNDAKISAYNSVISAEKSKNFVWIPYSKNYYAEVLMKCNLLDSADYIFRNELLSTADTIYYRKLAQDIYLNYALLNIEKQDKDLSLKYAYLAESINAYDKKSFDKIKLNFAIAKAEYLNGNINLSKQILQKILEQYSNQFELSFKLKILDELIKIAYSQNDNALHLEYLYSKIAIQDSLKKINDAEILKKMEVEFQTKEKDYLLKNALLERDKLQLRLVLIVAITFAIIVVSILYYLRYTFQQKAKALLFEKEKQNMLNLLNEKSNSIEEKNIILKSIQTEYDKLKMENINLKNFDEIINSLKDESLQIKTREEFELKFNELYPDFYKNIKQKFPSITPAELRIIAFIRMNFNSKDIANFLGITPGSVDTQRSRIRKKMNLSQDENFFDFLTNL